MNEGYAAYWLRPAVAADVDFVYHVRAAGMKGYVERIWGWNKADQIARFEDSFAPDRYQIVVIEGQDVGAVSVHRRADGMLVADIELLPLHRGRGLGTAIIRSILSEAKASGAPVALQVFKDNPARRLYERLGFAVTGETETHVLMSTDPPGLTAS